MPFGIRSRRILRPTGETQGVLVIDGEKILSIEDYDLTASGLMVQDVGKLVVMAGLVDGHVHINEPGRTQWEGFWTATRAAAAGGITTVIDMPLNCTPVTTSVEALETKLAAVGDQLHVDVGFWGGVVPGNAPQMSPLVSRGVLGCKAFMIHSGIDDFPMSNVDDLRQAMIALRDAGAPLLAHAEVDLGAGESGSDPSTYDSYLHSRPQSWETEAIKILIDLCRETGCAVHVVHLSAAAAIPMLRSARAAGLPITVETCPHYLCLQAESVPDGATLYKCAPPIRPASNQAQLWAALEEGVIDCVVSDHSPCVPQLKKLETGNFHEAWGGIASLQLGLSSIWTEMRARKIPLHHLARWMSAEPARLAGIADRKGDLGPGMDADITIWDPKSTIDIQEDTLHFRHRVSPYLGQTQWGVVKETWLRGKPIYRNGTHGEPAGLPLLQRKRGK